MADIITRPLSMIFQWSWEFGEVSVTWTLADVGPIFKKGGKNDPENHRTVSLISVRGEIMNKIILELLKNT